MTQHDENRAAETTATAKPRRQYARVCRRCGGEGRLAAAYRYICRNCGAGRKSRYVEAMAKAGFALRHLECNECGQQALVDRRAGE